MTTRTDRTDLDFEEYRENMEALDRLDEEIAALASRKSLTDDEERRLDALRESERVLKAAIADHKRRCLVERMSFDGEGRLHGEPGHTPAADLDGE